MPMTEAQKRAVAKYEAANTKRFTFKVNKNTEADILEWLEQQERIQTAIKKALREYMAAHK